MFDHADLYFFVSSRLLGHSPTLLLALLSTLKSLSALALCLNSSSSFLPVCSMSESRQSGHSVTLLVTVPNAVIMSFNKARFVHSCHCLVRTTRSACFVMPHGRSATSAVENLLNQIGSWSVYSCIDIRDEFKLTISQKISPALTVLTKLIYSLDDEILIDACWAISYLSDGSNDKIQAVIESGVCRRLVDLLMHPSTSVQTPALRSVGNIVTGDDLQTQVVIASGALQALLSLLSSPKEGIRKEACWTISNVTAGSPPQIQSVIDANIIPPLIDILRNADFKTKKEACWALSNATSGGLQEPAQIRYLVSQGCIGPLCDLLNSMDNKIIQVALDGLDNILKVGEMDRQAAGPGAVNQYSVFVEEAGGMVTIHNLQQHDNLEIYKKAYNIMEKYFPDDEDIDTGVSAPAVDSSGAFAVRHIILHINISTSI
jgi:hypothetical protein